MRESLILLGEEGLVRVFPKVGSFVSRVDAERVADAQFLREAVELAAFDDIPETLDPDLVAELRANLEQQREAGTTSRSSSRSTRRSTTGCCGSAGTAGHGRRSSRPRGTWTARAASACTRPTAWAASSTSTMPSSTRWSPATSPAPATASGAHLRAVFDDIEKTRQRSPELFAADDGLVPVRRSIAVWE